MQLFKGKENVKKQHSVNLLHYIVTVTYSRFSNSKLWSFMKGIFVKLVVLFKIVHFLPIDIKERERILYV